MSNLYNSLLRTFNAFRFYSKTLPVTPPADLTLSGSLFTPKFVFSGQVVSGGIPSSGPACAFNRLDNPRLRGAGFFGNLADGLVDAATMGDSTNSVFRLGFKLERYGAKLTGVISNTAGLAAVTGIGTLFTEELAPGMTITWEDDGLNIRQGVIQSIADNTNLTLTGATNNTASSMFAGVNTTSVDAFPKILDAGDEKFIDVATMNHVYPQDLFVGDVSMVRPIEGRVTFQNAIAGGANTTATGLGTTFTRDVTAGQWIRYVDDNLNTKTVMVTSVDSDTQLTITTPAAGTAGLATAATRVIVGTDGWMDVALAVLSRMVTSLEFYTVTIDPAFATRLLNLHIVAEIEHSDELVGSLIT